MPTKTFDDFVKRRLNEAQTNSFKVVDWDKTREEWIRSLNGLYSKMETYLKKYTEADQIQVKRERIQISEEYLGNYEAEKLTIQIGNDKVVALCKALPKVTPCMCTGMSGTSCRSGIGWHRPMSPNMCTARS